MIQEGCTNIVETDFDFQLSSAKSMQISLEGIRLGQAGLNTHRKKESSDDRNFLRAIKQKHSIVVSAYDGHEIIFSTSLFE